jgi:hypothetical protein
MTAPLNFLALKFARPRANLSAYKTAELEPSGTARTYDVVIDNRNTIISSRLRLTIVIAMSCSWRQLWPLRLAVIALRAPSDKRRLQT